MKFNILGEVEKGSYLTIGVEGSSKTQLVIEDIENEPTYLDTGVFINFPIIN